jgi:hypothetical protein
MHSSSTVKFSHARINPDPEFVHPWIVRSDPALLVLSLSDLLEQRGLFDFMLGADNWCREGVVAGHIGRRIERRCGRISPRARRLRIAGTGPHHWSVFSVSAAFAKIIDRTLVVGGGLVGDVAPDCAVRGQSSEPSQYCRISISGVATAPIFLWGGLADAKTISNS